MPNDTSPYDLIKKNSFPRKRSLFETVFDISGMNRIFLRKGKRTSFDVANDGFVSPVEGKLIEVQHLSPSKEIGGKRRIHGQEYYSFEEIVHGVEEEEKFKNGVCLNFYLSPFNLHYVLFPMDMQVNRFMYHPSFCWPILFFKWGEVTNERLVIYGQTRTNCPVILVLVGSFMVSGIECVAKQEVWYSRGELLGAFKLGSTVMMLFPEGSIETHIEAGKSVELGEPIGRFL